MSKKIIDEEDINIVIEQGDVSRLEAKKLLKKYNGDIVKCLLEINEGTEQNENISEEDEIEDVKINEQNLINYREIINEKENMYKRISDEKEERKKNKKETPKLNNEELYYLSVKGNFTSIRVL